MDDAVRLVDAVQQLSLARSLGRIVEIVRHAARDLTGADGATFVLRERTPHGDQCHYVDEDAIQPLWKGRRFPASSCISGWVMRHGCAAVVGDVFLDARIPQDVYAHTFVRSLVMVPIRPASPIGAIGAYWAHRREPTAEEIARLQALADSTSLAMESIDVHAEKQALVEAGRRREELAALLVHDIKGPASGLMLRAEARLRNDALGDAERRAWTSVYAGGQAIVGLALNLLDIARSEDGTLALSPCAFEIESLVEELEPRVRPLAEARGERLAMSSGDPRAAVYADRNVLLRILQNLIENAILHGPVDGTVRLDAEEDVGGVVLSVSDEGPGVPADQRERVFEKYAQLEERSASRTGRGLGLAFCRLAVGAHGGHIWVEENRPQGARFCVRLPHREASPLAYAPPAA